MSIRRAPIAAVFSMICVSCGAVEESVTSSERGEVPPAYGALRSFELPLDRAMTAETATSQIAAGAREQLAAACAEWSASSIRIFNPLDPGDFIDVSCATIRGDDMASCETSAALASEAVGEARQNWSILGLGCSLFVLGVSAFLHAGCDLPSAEDPKKCHDVTTWSFGALGVACAFL